MKEGAILLRKARGKGQLNTNALNIPVLSFLKIQGKKQGILQSHHIDLLLVANRTIRCRKMQGYQVSKKAYKFEKITYKKIRNILFPTLGGGGMACFNKVAKCAPYIKITQSYILISEKKGTKFAEVAAFFSAICSYCKEIKEPLILCQTSWFVHYWPNGCS